MASVKPNRTQQLEADLRDAREEIEQLKAHIAELEASVSADTTPARPTLNELIDGLIWEANHLVSFINKLPENAVWPHADLANVIDKLKILQRHMARRRKRKRQGNPVAADDAADEAH